MKLTSCQNQMAKISCHRFQVNRRGIYSAGISKSIEKYAGIAQKSSQQEDPCLKTFNRQCFGETLAFIFGEVLHD